MLERSAYERDGIIGGENGVAATERPDDAEVPRVETRTHRLRRVSFPPRGRSRFVAGAQIEGRPKPALNLDDADGSPTFEAQEWPGTSQPPLESPTLRTPENSADRALNLDQAWRRQLPRLAGLPVRGHLPGRSGL
jgi:hypothetical protein